MLSLINPLLVALIALAALPLPAQAQKVSEQTPQEAKQLTSESAQRLDGSDPYHPRHFVEIVECASAASGCTKPRTIIQPDATSEGERVGAEVDIDSKILIRFDREALATLSDLLVGEGVGPFVAAIEISARIGDRPVEVPGYFETGEKAVTAAAVVRSGGGLTSAFSSARGLLRRVSSAEIDAFDLTASHFRLAEDTLETLRQRQLSQQIAEAKQRADAAETERSALLRDHNAGTRTQLVTLRENMVALESDIELARATAASVEADAVRVAARQNTLEGLAVLYNLSASSASAHQLIARLDGLQVTEDEARALVDKATSSLNTLAEGAQRDIQDRQNEARANRRRVEGFRQKMLSSRGMTTGLIKLLSDSTNRALIEAYSDLIRPVANPDVLISTAGVVSTAFNMLGEGAAPQEPAEYVATLRVLHAIYQGLVDLQTPGGGLSDEDERKLRRRLLYQLADTAISPRDADAQIGNDLIITITNRVTGQAVPRTLTVRLRVDDFGLVQQVADSFLLLNRKGISPTSSAALLDDGVERARDVEFEPAPGASLVWTWRPRRRQGLMADVARFLRPGFGVNVSFPRFGIIERETIAGSEDGVAVVTENQGLDVAAGGVLTLFDNALSLTVGQPLTSRIDAPTPAQADALRSSGVVTPSQGSNWYVGVGFSFVGIADKLAR